MTANIHPLVELMVRRAESHPKEFYDWDWRDDRLDSGRWANAIRYILEYGSEEDKAFFTKVIGRIKMDEGHEWALDELMNGDERRAQFERDRQLQEAKAQAYHQQMRQIQPSSYHNALSNAPQGSLTSLAQNPSFTQQAMQTVQDALFGGKK